jgi:hypothetical protein
MEEKICFSPFINFENTRTKSDQRITQLENCVRQIYEFGRFFDCSNLLKLRYVFICRKGQKFVSPHLQIMNGKFIYDPYFEFLKNTEGGSVYISDILGLPEENDLIAKCVRRILNHILLEYSLHDGEEDLRRCRTLSFPEYFRFYQRLP